MLPVIFGFKCHIQLGGTELLLADAFNLKPNTNMYDLHLQNKKPFGLFKKY